MSNQFCFVPTGEHRQPHKGEWCEFGGNIYRVEHDFLEDRAPIYRRVPFAVVLGLVSAASEARQMTGHNHWDHTMQHGAGCSLCITQREIMERNRAALAAAREAGITEEVK